MKILKILGIVAAVHVVAGLLLFAIQGCSSTSKSATPAQVDNAPAAATPVEVSPVTPVSGADLNPATTPASPTVSYNGGEALYSPTRPGTPAAAAIATSQPVTNVTPAAAYTVAKGDSFSKIAAKYHLSSAELAKANNLKLSSPLRIGQKLIIPGKAAAAPRSEQAGAPAGEGGATYTVKSGDSLRAIAKRYGTTTTVLKSLNHLKSDTVRVGQVLQVPAGAAPAPAPADTISTTAASTAASDAKNAGGTVTHTVKPGEKLAAIAKKYGVTVGELATANNISDPGKIRAGQQLVIPTSSAGSKTAAKPAAAPAPSATPPPANEDLDTGLKPSAEEPPVIKVDDANNSSAPAPAPQPGTSTTPQNP
ncbi:MAG TPA: LysM peptidoglycan-binding domain-containing protein [Opitutaceae bacterium]|nr:LysM peptidoglycan-binding domain-containing protein [Opitutaceae bacterium]